MSLDIDTQTIMAIKAGFPTVVLVQYQEQLAAFADQVIEKTEHSMKNTQQVELLQQAIEEGTTKSRL